MKEKLALVLSVLTLFAGPDCTRAATHTWSGAGAATNRNWTNSANWSSGGVPTTAEAAPLILVFPSGLSTAALTNVDNISGLHVDQLQIKGTNYNISPAGGATLSLTGSTNPAFLGTASAAAFWSVPLSLLAGTRFSVSNLLNIATNITGAGGITKAGPGTLTFSGASANTYSGTTSVDEGELDLAKSAGVNAVPNNLIIGDGLSGYFTDVVTILNDNQIAATVSVTINSSGYLVIPVHDQTIGSLTLTGGGGILGPTAKTVTLGGDVTCNTSPNTAVISGRLSLGAATRTFNVVGGGTTPALNISGELLSSGASAGLLKTGAGTLRISGSNAFAGPISVSAGVLEAANNAALGAISSATTVSNGGVLRLVGVSITNESLTFNGAGDGNGALQATNGALAWAGPITLGSSSSIGILDSTNSLDLSGVISGIGVLTKVGGGRLRLSGSGANTFNGVTVVSGGTLELAKTANALALPGNVTIGGGPGGADSYVVSLLASNQIADTATVTISSSGLFQLNTFSETIGGLNISAGHVSVSAPGVLTLGGDVTTDSKSIPGLMDGSGGLSLGSATRTFDIGGSVIPNLQINLEILAAASNIALVKSGGGTLRISGFNSLAGPINIGAGTLEAASASALGATSGATTVSNGAVLRLVGVSIIGEPLTLNGTGDGNGALQATNGSLTWSGPITLPSSSSIGVLGTTNSLNLSGALGSVGGLAKVGTGTLRFSGSTPNTHSGGTYVFAGTLELGKPAGTAAVPSGLWIGDDLGGPNADAVRLVNANQISDDSEVLIYSSGLLDLAGLSETIGSFGGGGSVTLGAGTLGVLLTSGTGVYYGSISGTGGLVKSGAGTLVLSGTNTYSGLTLVSSGILQVDGFQPASAVQVNGSARLQGTGTVGPLIGSGNAFVFAPGDSPGILTCSNFAGGGTGILEIELNGATPGSGYDQLNVRGTVNLAGLALNASLNFGSALSNRFMIILNDGADAVSGTFNALPEGATLTVGGQQFRISYAGGDGNDVMFTQLTGKPSLSSLLTATNTVFVSWPSPSTGFALQQNTNLATTNWVAATNAVTDNGAVKFIIVNHPTGQRFYRLIQ